MKFIVQIYGSDISATLILLLRQYTSSLFDAMRHLTNFSCMTLIQVFKLYIGGMLF